LQKSPSRQKFGLSSSCHAGGNLTSALASSWKTAIATSPVTNSQPY